MKKQEAGTQPKKKRHILRNILLILLGFIAAIACLVMINASRNKKHMNLCADTVLDLLKADYDLKPVDCSEFEDLKVYGIMKFDITQYDAENLGNICVMKANAGVMQMLTLTVTPTQKDMPLMSVDYMYMLGNRTAYIEIYDLNVSESEVHTAAIEQLKGIGADFKTLTDTEPTPAWYDSIRTTGSFKKVKVADDDAILEMLKAYATAYLTGAKDMEALTDDQSAAKIEALEAYTHRLISEGGVSTDVFKKELGEDKTTRFFDSVMFGTANYTASK